MSVTAARTCPDSARSAVFQSAGSPATRRCDSAAQASETAEAPKLERGQEHSPRRPRLSR